MNEKSSRKWSPRPPAWPEALVPNLALLTAITALFFLPIFMHPNRMFWASDIVRAHAEYKTVQWKSLWEYGTFPLWDPTVFCGKSIVGDPLPALLYPPAFLFWLIPAPALFGFFLWFQVTLGAWGVFLFARRKGCDLPGALFAALAFALAGKTGAHVFAGHVELLSTIMGLPWMLWGVERALQEPKWQNSALLGAIAALVAFSGSVQMFYYHVLFVGAYVFLWAASEWADNGRKSVLRATFCLAGGSLVFAAAAAPFWFPVIRQTLILGARSRGTDFVFSSQGSASFRDLLGLLWPNLSIPPLHVLAPDAVHNFFWETSGFAGVITLCLAVSALVSLKNVRGVTGLAILLFLSVTLALGENSPVFWLAHKIIPGFSYFRCPGRLLFYAGFTLALLAGLMVSHGRSGQPRWVLGVICCLMFEGALVGGLFLGRGAETPIKGLWIPLAVTLAATPAAFVWGSGHIRNSLWQVGLITLLVADLFLFWRPLINVIPPRQAFPPFSAAEFLAERHKENEFRIYDPTGMIEQQTAARYGLELITGYHPGIYGRHLDMYRKIWRSDNSDITEQAMHTPLDAGCPVILDLMNVEYILAFEPDLGPEYERVYQAPEHESKQPRYVYHRKNSLPRAWMTARAVTPPNNGSVLDSLCGMDPRVECLVESEPVEGSAEYQALPLERRSPADATARFSTTVHGVAVISQSWHPDWRATDNGKPVAIRRVNYNLLGIPLGAGNHVLRVYYWPWDFYLGLGAASVAWVAIMGTGIRSLIRRRNAGDVVA